MKLTGQVCTYTQHSVVMPIHYHWRTTWWGARLLGNPDTVHEEETQRNASNILETIPNEHCYRLPRILTI